MTVGVWNWNSTLAPFFPSLSVVYRTTSPISSTLVASSSTLTNHNHDGGATAMDRSWAVEPSLRRHFQPSILQPQWPPPRFFLGQGFAYTEAFDLIFIIFLTSSEFSFCFRFVIFCFFQSVRLYDASANALRGEFMHGGPVLDCCFHDDSSGFSASGDHTVRRLFPFLISFLWYNCDLGR